MTKTVAIVQSNYIPWKGYFDLINSVDEFILFDDMQYTRRDWRNRNRIKTPQGVAWLTVPVEVKGRYHQAINETVVSDPRWRDTHWRTLEHNYARARCFQEYRAAIEELYRGSEETYLSRINHSFLTRIAELLGISTTLTWSSDYGVVEGKTERLVDLCQKAGATDYVSGPSAREYIDPAVFDAANIRLHYMDYSGYREYDQLYPPFEHGVSILDMLFNLGPDAPSYMKSFTQRVS